MNRVVYFIIVLFCTFSTQAQKGEKKLTRSVINTLKSRELLDPQWKINFYFEDGVGARDTISFAYEPNSSHEHTDTAYGEVFEVVDTTKFNVYLFSKKDGVIHSPPSPPIPPIDTDMLMKHVVSPWPYPGGQFGVVHGQLPVHMTWDMEQLDSSDLPSIFVDMPEPKYRAKIGMDYHTFSDGLYPQCSSWIDIYPVVLLMNYPVSNFTYNERCMYNDAMWWWNEDGGEFADIIYDALLVIVPYNHSFSAVNTAEQVGESIRLGPNPTSDFISINDEDKEYSYTVYNIVGEIQKEGVADKIDLQDLSNGVYLVKVNGQIFNIVKQ